MGPLTKYLNSINDKQLPGLLAFGIKEAYKFLDELIKKNKIMQCTEFKKSYGYMRNSLVDIALKQVMNRSSINGKFLSQSVNKSMKNGYTYSSIEVGNAIILPTKTRTKKSLPKKALHRDSGCTLNRQLDLFNLEEKTSCSIDAETKMFLLLVYGGRNYNLDYVELGLPDVKDEKWIEVVNIKDSPILLTSNQIRKTKERLKLSFTNTSKEILEDGKIENS